MDKLLAFDSEHKRRAENLAFDLDVWYPRLRAFTFPTVFVPLTLAEAQAVVHYYQEVIQGRQGRLTVPDAQSLSALERRLDAVLREEPLAGGAFPRLCGRSLKDADPLRPDEALRRYRSELDQLLAQKGDGGCPEMQALLRVPWMRVETGAEALALLLSSERAFADLKDWTEFGEPEQLALRKWQPELTQDWEFRIFVHEGQLTGISQYEHYCHYPALEPSKGKLEAMIVAFWRRMHASVGAESYVADLGYLRSEDRLVLVELGPFLPCTGTSCFSWKHDSEQLRHGPFEFRSTSADRAMPAATVAELVEVSWLDRWRHPHQWRHGATSHSVVLHALLAAEEIASQKRAGRATVVAAALGAGLAFAATPSASSPGRRLQAAALGAASAALAVPAALRLQKRAARCSQQGSSVVLFVYGTLKRGFHWHQKYLSLHASFVAAAETVEPWPLVVGRCGVPYVLLDRRGLMGEEARECRVRGELWKVDASALGGMDEYEGVSKGYYARIGVDCIVDEKERQKTCGVAAAATVHATVHAQMYGVVASQQFWSEEELGSLRCVAEYTREMQDALYRPIEHIGLKQQLYLSKCRRYNAVDDHEAPTSMT